MTTFLLIRHATNDSIDRMIPGRAPGLFLNEAGKTQADTLAQRLSTVPIRAVYSSPLERARETAAPIAKMQGLDVIESDAFNEINLGQWTGLHFTDLNKDERWHRFNLFRSGTRVPNGELMIEVQCRVVAELERLRHLYQEALVAVISHGDVIKSAIAHYTGISLDLILKFEVSPASVSVMSVSDHESRLMLLNHTGGILEG